jgi:toxin ParE1/3/4
LKIIWSPLAIQKISEYADIIALDKPMVVEKWTEDIFDSIQRLSVLPYSGKIVAEIGQKDLREVFNGNYRVIYKILSNEIHILTVRHRRQLLNEKDLT